ncbi:flagellar basal-body rod protein FlgG [Amphibiibacter pelophylacis]|uniref:Flagellar basal-body rod protein FlgG n=1 Tax=Amphibiibacter pelophylacis TaxID=1799477 RepID=A0ACC6P4J6_9BURK
MIRSLWIAKTGMEAQQMQLDAVSHNLANSSTTGFKRSHVEFEDLIYQNLRQVGSPNGDEGQLPTGLQLGLGVRPVATARNFEQGGLQQTTNELDMAINGRGFFQIELPDGTTAYTRNGHFKLDSQGQIVDNNGLRLQPGFTVPADTIKVSISSRGEVSATLPGQATPQVLGQIQLANFVNAAGLEPKGDNLFTQTAASGEPVVAEPGTQNMGLVNQGYVENSNVNVVEELVTMIQTQRAYELNAKAITTSDQMLAKLAQL